MTHTKIGELNGRWGILFKITQVLIPIAAVTLLPWCVWVTSTLYARELRITKLELFASVGPRFTGDNAEALRVKIMSDVEMRLAGGNQRILDRIDMMVVALTELKLELTRHISSTEKKSP